MDEIKLDVQIRDMIGTRKSKVIKRNGYLPAVVYGGSKTPTSIQIDRRAFEKILRLHHGENVVFQLNVLEKDKKVRDYSVIAKEMQYDPVTDQITHVDFQRISLTEKIEVEVSIVTKGEAIGVKQDGGSVDQIQWKLDVVCLPTNIPHHIEVDISNLKLHDSIYVKDLVLPQGVITKHDPQGIVLSLIPPMKEISAEELAAAQETAATEPEVIKEKPKVKEEAAPAAGAAKKPEEKAKPEGK